jgi:hypothetical protein
MLYALHCMSISSALTYWHKSCRKKVGEIEPRGQFHHRSTCSFYVRKLSTQLFWCLHFMFVLYWRKPTSTKAARRTLMKLSLGLTLHSSPRKIFLLNFKQIREVKVISSIYDISCCLTLLLLKENVTFFEPEKTYLAVNQRVFKFFTFVRTKDSLPFVTLMLHYRAT